MSWFFYAGCVLSDRSVAVQRHRWHTLPRPATWGALLASALALQGCFGKSKSDEPETDAPNSSSEESELALSGLSPSTVLETNNCNHVELDGSDINDEGYATYEALEFVTGGSRLTVNVLPNEYIDDPLLYLSDLQSKCQDGLWLATTSQGTVDRAVGAVSLSSGDIRISFETPLSPPIDFATTVGLDMGMSMTITLLDQNGEAIQEETFRESPIMYQPCDGLDGTQPFSPTTVGLHAEEAVKHVVLSGEHVKRVREFFFSSGDGSGTDACPWAEDGTISDPLPRCDIGDATRVSYTCVAKTSVSQPCDELNAESMNEALDQQWDHAKGTCIPVVRSLLCGPDPNEELECCYFTELEEQMSCVD